MGADSTKIVEYRGYYSELLDCYFELDDCSFIIVKIAVVGSREDCDDSGELLLSSPVVHLESVCLSLMSPND